jgi:hypothetical protein
MAATAIASSSKLTMDQTNAPAWGSYLYQNFLLPTLSPNLASQWLTSPFGLTTHETTNNGNNGNAGNNVDYNDNQLPAPPGDYFGSSWDVKIEPGTTAPPVQPMNNAQSYQNQPPTYSQSQTPSWSFFGGSIPTSLLTANQQPQLPISDNKNNLYPYPSYNASYNREASGSRSGGPAKISPLSVEAVDDLVASPSPMLSSRNSPHHSPKKGKRRALSMDSNDDHYDHEQDHEVPEGVEKDGMIWGMRVDDYRALSARERKRVRNRISARTFRAKRKGELYFLTRSARSLMAFRTPQLTREHLDWEGYADQVG